MPIQMIRGSGNVFLDMGFPPAEAANLQMRSDLLSHLRQLVLRSGVSQKEMAKRLGVTQPRVSDIVRGNIDRFGIDSLVQLLDRLGITVELKTRSRKLSPPAASKHARRKRTPR